MTKNGPALLLKNGRPRSGAEQRRRRHSRTPAPSRCLDPCLFDSQRLPTLEQDRWDPLWSRMRPRPSSPSLALTAASPCKPSLRRATASMRWRLCLTKWLTLQEHCSVRSIRRIKTWRSYSASIPICPHLRDLRHASAWMTTLISMAVTNARSRIPLLCRNCYRMTWFRTCSTVERGRTWLNCATVSSFLPCDLPTVPYFIVCVL
mmetsp:Transcript_27884/g.41271  ORF Transcript_27884/g.41271 Transcript_27884/m.41271 type:complete len:205 (+) Transcript_27884:1406-2020(+)